MAESNVTSEKNASPQMLAELIERHRQNVIKLVESGLENDQIECKTHVQLGRSELASQIRFIKLVAALSNQPRSTEGYLVIGADIANKTFRQVQNASDFDPANLENLFKKFLDPQPIFQVHELKSELGDTFIVLIFSPSQRRPITICKSSDVDRIAIREGEVWIKSGTVTGLASRRQLDQIYEERLEAEAEAKARQRFSHFRDELEFRSPPNREVAELPDKGIIVGSRKLLQTFIASAIATGETRRLRMLIEIIRDVMVNHWAISHRNLTGNVITTEAGGAWQTEFRDYLLNEFEPALAALNEIALMLIKHYGPVDVIGTIADVLREHFDLVSELSQQGLNSQLLAVGFRSWRTLAQVYAVSRCIAVYAFSRNRYEYVRPIVTIMVQEFNERWGEAPSARPLLFMPIEVLSEYEEFRFGRIEYVWTGWVSARFADYFKAYKGFTDSATLHETVLELNSFLGLGFTDLGAPVSRISGKDALSWVYYPDIHRLKPRAVGLSLTALKPLFSDPGLDLAGAISEQLVRQLHLLHPNAQKLFDRFVFVVWSGARNIYRPNDWVFDDWTTSFPELKEAVTRGKANEERLEAANPR